MPRDGSDVYNVPSGTYGIEDTTIESARYNAFVDDVAQDLNHPRPILAGGTGETNAQAALITLGAEFAQQLVNNYDSDVLHAGSFYSTATATSAPVTGHAFAGIVVVTDANNMLIQAYDQTVLGRKYVRLKAAGVWGSWKPDGRSTIGTNEGIDAVAGDMFFGVSGVAPNSQFIVNNKADASGTNLMTVSKTGVMTGDGFIKPGFMMDYGGDTAPAGWLVCDGSAVSRATYAALFTAIGTRWGAGDGSTTFNLPPLTNRFRRQTGNLAGAVGTLQGPCNLTHSHPVVGATGAADRSLDHLHGGVTAGMDRNTSHAHGLVDILPNQVLRPGTGGSAQFFGGPVAVASIAQAAAITATDINHLHTFVTNGMDRSIDHLHGIAITSGGGSADNASEARPYSATVLTCIKT
jgi:microcystin-dependent protein